MSGSTNFIDTLIYDLKANMTIIKTILPTVSEDGFAHIIFLTIFGVLLIIPIISLLFRRQLISQKKKKYRIWGEIFSKTQIFISIFGIVLLLLSYKYLPKTHFPILIFAITIMAYMIYSGIKIKRAFIYRKTFQYDAINHSIQVAILIIIGIFIIFIVWLFGIKDSSSFVPFSIFAALISWIFKDSIQGVIAYIYLRSNGLLHIGDWIQIPELNIDGTVTDISLITLTVRNWDTTTSNVAISKLQTNSFKNNQEMLNGNTEGRRMYRSFTIDSSSISALDKQQITLLKLKLQDLGIDTYFLQKATENKSEILNLQLFRIYLRHWLTNHHEISHLPRLLVRIMEPSPEGIPIQIYAFIRKYNLYQFELVQSEISEYAILSMSWFGLRLYQQPASKDVKDFVNIINSKKDK